MVIRDGYKIISMEIPIEIDLSGAELIYYLYHLTKAFGKSGDEFDEYLDSITPKNRKTIDELYARFLKGIKPLDLKYKIYCEKEKIKNDKNTT